MSTGKLYYDIINAAFAFTLACFQVKAIYDNARGKGHQPGLTLILWALLSVWGLFSLQLYFFFGLWTSFAATIASVVSNLVLALQAFLRGKKRQERDRVLLYADCPPEAKEGAVYYDSKRRAFFKCVNGQWIAMS